VNTLPAASRSDEYAEYPLSHGQRALWYVYRSAPDSSAYNVSYAWRVHCTTGVDSGLLRRVLAILVARHAALRTTYFMGPDGEPRQRVAVAAALDFEEIDASAWEESLLRRWIADEAHRPFDLERGPVLRARFLRTSQASPILLLAVHHIAVDGWSLYVLLEEMDHLYAQEAGQFRTELRPSDPLDYLKYVRFQEQLLQSPERKRLLTYWEHQLSGDLPTLALPTDFPRGQPSTAGAQCSFEIGPPCSERLRSVAGKHGTTLSVLLSSAFQVLLSRYSGQDDVVVGTPMSGRRRPDTRDTFGYLVNPVCLRASVAGNPSFTSRARS
jgi:condensation domain-containing protein